MTDLVHVHIIGLSEIARVSRALLWLYVGINWARPACACITRSSLVVVSNP